MKAEPLKNSSIHLCQDPQASQQNLTKVQTDWKWSACMSNPWLSVCYRSSSVLIHRGYESLIVPSYRALAQGVAAHPCTYEGLDQYLVCQPRGSPLYMLYLCPLLGGGHQLTQPKWCLSYAQVEALCRDRQSHGQAPTCWDTPLL